MRVLIFFYIISFSYSTNLFSAKQMICAIPKDIYPLITPLFRKPITYTTLKVVPKQFQDNQKTLTALQKDPEIHAAIIRADILYRYQYKKTDKNYMSLSTLPYYSTLYLIHPSDNYDIDIDMLRGSDISIGSLGDENSYLLKSVLELYQSEYTIHYHAFSLDKSYKLMESGEIDHYFGFLPSEKENSAFHFQTLFSKDVIEIFKGMPALKIDYSGIHVPYILVISQKASDEEIENLIYLLEKKNILSIQTDELYGPIDLYIVQHLEQVQKALQILASTPTETIPDILSGPCLSYHYGFLDLLRRKPSLKKKVRLLHSRNTERYRLAKSYLQMLESILLSIDRQKIHVIKVLDKKYM